MEFMGLIDFLTIGHSLTDIKDEPSPYRMSSENWLPNFSSAGATPALGTDKPASDADRAVGPHVQNHRDLAQASAARELGTESTAQARKPSRTGRLDPAPAAQLAAKRIAVKKTKRKVRFFGFRTSMESAQRLKQAELRLESVQVMRNDLKDSDVELVVKASTPLPGIPEGAPPANGDQEAGGGERGWAARWFKSGRLLF